MVRPLLVSLLAVSLAHPALALESAPDVAAGAAPTCTATPLAAVASLEFTAPALLVPGEAPVRPAMASELALPSVDNALTGASALSLFGRHRKPHAPRPAIETLPLGAERARILLRSLTIPGWGQATVGRRHAAAFFGVAELGVWTAFTSFRVQELLRRQDYERTAKLFAGIDLKGRDDEYQRIVGAFASSDQYNLYVVARDAANLYMSDPYHADIAKYRAYIAAHSIGGSDAWSWADEASFDRYRAQRKNSQRAALRANSALGLAIANRLVSALHAMRASAHPAPVKPQGTSWRFEVTPGDPAEPVAFRAGLHASF